MARHQSFSEKFWQDKHGKVVVAQKPNALLWLWIGALVVSIILPNNAFQRLVSFVGEIAIVLWAILELGWGVNYFRRLLGLGVLLLIAVSRFL